MNLKVRFKDPLFIVQLITMIFGIITQAVAINISEITTWQKLGEVLIGILSNPYVLGTIIFNVAIGLINLFRDPTTSGLSDSARALNYQTTNDSDINYGVEISGIQNVKGDID